MIVRIESLKWYSEEDEYSNDKEKYKIVTRFVKEEDIILHYHDSTSLKFHQSVQLTTTKELIRNVINISYPIHNDKYLDPDHEVFFK